MGAVPQGAGIVRLGKAGGGEDTQESTHLTVAQGLHASLPVRPNRVRQFYYYENGWPKTTVSWSDSLTNFRPTGAAALDNLRSQHNQLLIKITEQSSDTISQRMFTLLLWTD